MDRLITILMLVYLMCSCPGHLNAALLSRNKYLLASSQYWLTNQAVDGVVQYDADNCFCCAATYGEMNPWYQLDLGQEYTINSIVVEGRQDHKHGQHFKGMRILFHSVKNGFENPETTVSEQTFNYSYTLPQPTSTRFVSLVLFNRNDAFTICELSVFGDCQDGEFGHVCEKKCHCEGEPCGDDGVCPSGVCLPGYKGVRCDTECEPGKYGPGCTNTCKNCLDDAPCERTDGSCKRCIAGYQGSMCRQECLYSYGDGCLRSCGYCLDGAACHHVTGECTDGCDQGYKAPLCNEVCDEGHHCNEGCGHCAGDDVCSDTDGTCPNGCKEGYKPPTCRTVISGASLFTPLPLFVSLLVALMNRHVTEIIW